MDFNNFNNWIVDFYKEKGWFDLNTFIRMNFLNEEVGELAREVRRIEIGRERPDEAEIPQSEMLDEIKGEIGDVLDNLIIIAAKYNIDFDEVFLNHQNKLISRYNENKKD